MNLFKNYLYSIFYQMLIILVPIITIPYISRVLGANGIGTYAYTLSIVSYFILVGGMGTILYGTKMIAQAKLNDEVTQTFFEIQIMRFVFYIITAILYFLFLSLFKTDIPKIYFYIQGIELLTAAIDISWLFIGLEQIKKTVVRNTIVKMISVLLIFLFVKREDDLIIYFAIIIFSNFFGNLSLWMFIKKIVSFSILKKIHFEKHRKPILSLFIPQVSLNVYLLLNKSMLGYMESVAAAGYYENSDKFIKILLAFITAGTTVLLPRISSERINGNISKANELFMASLKFSFFMSLPLSFGLAAIIPIIAPAFFGNQFANIDKIIILLSPVLVFMAINNVVGQLFFIPSDNNKPYTIAMLVGTLTNFLLNIIFIPSFGIVGAVLSTLVSQVIIFVVQVVFLSSFLKIVDIFSGLVPTVISSFVMFISIYIINNIFNESIYLLIFDIVVGVMIFSIFMFLLNRNNIRKTISIFIGTRGKGV